VLFSSRRDDDADVIRARLRALLDDGSARRGWLPEDDAEDDPADAWGDDVVTVPVPPHGRTPGRVAPVGAPDTADPSEGPVDRVGRHRAAGTEVRVPPGRTGARAMWIAAVLAGALVVGWSWLGRPAVDPAPVLGAAVSSAPAAATVPPSPSTAAAAGSVVVVAVVGQVVSPGLVTLPAGSRVADALAAAGGLLPEADPASVNAAALVTDGQQIAVGVPGAGPAPAADGTPAVAGGPVDLNTATVADLDTLPGIGPVLAQRIVDHRTESGAFTSVEQLDDVSGIGPALYAEVSPLVTV